MTDAYQPPESDIALECVGNEQFYVVSPKKFLILFIGTAGLYQLYWFYKNWALYRTANSQPIMPVMRAIFSIFFAHKLFGAMDLALQKQQKSHDWKPGTLATVFVVLAIIGHISSGLAYKEIGSPITDFTGLLMLPIIIWTLYSVQLVVNMLCDDPQGESNSQLTPKNYFWIFLGCLLWLMTLFSYYTMLAL